MFGTMLSPEVEDSMNDTGYQDFFYQSQDGLRLHARIYGEARPDLLPVVCLPGLTRNAKDFHEIALYLAREADTLRQVIVFDYRGRGESAWDSDWKKYDVGVEAGDILAGLATLGIPKAIFIGTSRGGLILHVLAAVRPDVLGAVVLNDVGPVLEPEGLALIKSYLNSPAPRPTSFEEAAKTQKAAHGRFFTALDDDDWMGMAKAIYREKDGTLVPDFDPALLNGLAAFDLTQPLPTLWPQFEAMKAIPMMAIRGANSLLLSAKVLEEMGDRHPGMVATTVEGQGHAPFLHKGDLPRQIADFIDRA